MNQNTLPKCPVEAALALIGNRWKTLIIRDLLDGPKHFGELKRSLTGISSKVLTENLRSMESNHIIHREELDTAPMRVEYSLTSIGKEIEGVHDAIKQWVNRYKVTLSTTITT